MVYPDENITDSVSIPYTLEGAALLIESLFQLHFRPFCSIPQLFTRHGNLCCWGALPGKRSYQAKFFHYLWGCHFTNLNDTCWNNLKTTKHHVDGIYGNICLPEIPFFNWTALVTFSVLWLVSNFPLTPWSLCHWSVYYPPITIGIYMCCNRILPPIL